MIEGALRSTVALRPSVTARESRVSARSVHSSARARCLELATLHSLMWLVTANCVGLLLATLLLVPDLGAWLRPFQYGRWVPLHLDLQLYGWLSLPLVALLIRFVLPPESGRGPRLMVGAWSGSLLFGAVTWLLAGSSGKLFLEWQGSARTLLALTLLALDLTLLFELWRGRAAAGRWSRTVLLLFLLSVPAVLYWATDPAVSPPINPASGGPTGASLLGSSLGIVAIFLLVPILAGLQRIDGSPVPRRAWLVLVAHALVWALALDHGATSNHQVTQVVGLASVALWLPILPWVYRSYRMPAGSDRWIRALTAWGVLLVVNGIGTFLPGVLERWKFTSALVGHSHLAMAGAMTSFVVLILILVDRDNRHAAVFLDTRAFWLWHGGCATMVVVLMALGTIEGGDPGFVFEGAPTVTALFGVRWLAGLAMLVASAVWLIRATHARSSVPTGIAS